MHVRSATGRPPRAPARSRYMAVLAWSFAVQRLHVLAYLPTIRAIRASGDSQPHSWLTWLTWVGANAAMAAWLYEDPRRWTRAVAVNACNTLMCLATLVLILALRM